MGPWRLRWTARTPGVSAPPTLHCAWRKPCRCIDCITLPCSVLTFNLTATPQRFAILHSPLTYGNSWLEQFISLLGTLTVESAMGSLCLSVCTSSALLNWFTWNSAHESLSQFGISHSALHALINSHFHLLKCVFVNIYRIYWDTWRMLHTLSSYIKKLVMKKICLYII